MRNFMKIPWKKYIHGIFLDPELRKPLVGAFFSGNFKSEPFARAIRVPKRTGSARSLTGTDSSMLVPSMPVPQIGQNKRFNLFTFW